MLSYISLKVYTNFGTLPYGKTHTLLTSCIKTASSSLYWQEKFIFFQLSTWREAVQAVLFFAGSLWSGCRLIFFTPSPCEDGNGKLDVCIGCCPVCGIGIYQIPRNDGGAVFVGVDKIRNPDAEAFGFPSRKHVLRNIENKHWKKGKGGAEAAW